MDAKKLETFIGQAVSDMGATMSGLMIHLGDKLGLYKAMAGAGAMTSVDLAKKTGLHERYVREWLNNQAAGGYLTYDPATKAFTLPDEQAFCLANEESPVFMGGGYEAIMGIMQDDAKYVEAFKTGKGVGWHEHEHRLFHGTERFFRPGYAANLVSTWLPALEGVEAKLKSGAKVADVGCGHGASTIVMALAYPKSKFIGYDYHEASVLSARKAAQAAGVADRTSFEVASAKTFAGKDLDLVCFFDCLHDMGDPVGAARHTRGTLKPDGTVLLVEPMAGDKPEDNHHPVGRLFYAFSTVVCTPASLAQEVGLGLGAQAGEARLRAVMSEGGFTRFRRATETPFNLVLEARP